MSIKLFQNIINQSRSIVDSMFGIMDDMGLIVACSDEQKTGNIENCITQIIESDKDLIVLDGTSFKKINSKGQLAFVVFLQGESMETQRLLSLLALNFENAKAFYDEKYDKASFMRSIITESITAEDLARRVRDLHLVPNVPRCVYVIRTDSTEEVYTHDVIQNLFPNRSKDFVIQMEDESTVLIREFKPSEDGREVEKTARVIADTLSSETMVRVHVGVGSLIQNIKDIVRSYKEARTALDVGSIFENEKPVVMYSSLGVGRIIYQIPMDACKLFLEEVFKSSSLEDLDSETLFTVHKFFENNLNVSETSRQLYVHRNTLVYRLDKLQKITGLDIRMFDNAIIFKLALLVKRYMDREVKESSRG